MFYGFLSFITSYVVFLLTPHRAFVITWNTNILMGRLFMLYVFIVNCSIVLHLLLWLIL